MLCILSFGLCNCQKFLSLPVGWGRNDTCSLVKQIEEFGLEFNSVKIKTGGLRGVHELRILLPS